MGSSFTMKELTAALPYWYERQAYAFQATALTASGQVPLFSLAGWNGGGAPATLVTLRELQVDTWPGVQALITADSQSYRPYVDTLRRDVPTRGDWAAVKNLSAAITNQSATVIGSSGLTIPTLQGRYQVAIWQMPAFEQLLRGTGLSPTHTDYLKALGFASSVANPTDQRGNFPIPVSAIIERTYANRQVAPPIAWAQSTVATTSQVALTTLTASANQLLILRNLAGVAPAEAGVTLTVDRDNDASYVQWPANQLGRRGVDLFIPATNHLTLSIQATNPESTPVPVRMEVWVLSLSNILRARLGLLSEAGLQALLGTTQGTKFYEDIRVGVY